MNESGEVGWLTIRRTSPEDVHERHLYVSLDGARVAVLAYGDVATLPIAPGHHELRVHNTLSRKKLAFDSAAGQHIRVKTSNVRGRGFVYWALFAGVALMWTTLEREEDGPSPMEEDFPELLRI